MLILAIPKPHHLEIVIRRGSKPTYRQFSVQRKSIAVDVLSFGIHRILRPLSACFWSPTPSYSGAACAQPGIGRRCCTSTDPLSKVESPFSETRISVGEQGIKANTHAHRCCCCRRVHWGWFAAALRPKPFNAAATTHPVIPHQQQYLRSRLTLPSGWLDHVFRRTVVAPSPFCSTPSTDRIRWMRV